MSQRYHKDMQKLCIGFSFLLVKQKKAQFLLGFEQEHF